MLHTNRWFYWVRRRAVSGGLKMALDKSPYTYNRIFLFMALALVVISAVMMALSCEGVRGVLCHPVRVDSMIFRDKWPEPLVLLVEQAMERGIVLGDYAVYQVTATDYLLRAQGNDEALTWLQSSLDLTHVKCTNGMVRYAIKRLPQRHALFADATDTEYYYCRRGLAGEEGDMFLVMYHRKDGELGVWYYRNF